MYAQSGTGDDEGGISAKLFYGGPHASALTLSAGLAGGGGKGNQFKRG